MLTDTPLPAHILAKASLRGNEYAWQQNDIDEAIRAAKQAGLATIGGQTQFRLPDGTCELYWLSFDATPKQDTETWNTYVARSAEECLAQFYRRCRTADFKREGTEAFTFLRHKTDTEDLGTYLCFVIYFNTEEQYHRIRNHR